MSQKLPIKNKSRDLYSFGSIMPGREYTAQSVAGYRFGFNGKEKDDENKGKGNSIDYDFRIADTRLGRWLSIDRFEGKHPWTTPYGFLANNPIIFIDPDGNEIRLWAFTDLQSVAWQQLKNTIESRFNGLVVIDKVEKQTTPVWNGEFDKKGNPVMISKTYHQVTMTINEVQLRANAVAKLPINASTKDIDSKMEEMRTELKSGSTYKELENMITSPIVSNYQLTNHQFGAFAGGGNGQGINMKNISLFKDVKELGAFTILYHELEEGFSYYSAKKSGSSNLSYGFHHLKAITKQSKDLEILFMTNEMLSSEGFGGKSAWAVGGTMKISLYSLAVNGKINKITLSFELDEHGEFKKHDDKISYSVDKSIINKGQYNAEKKDYENKANGE